MIDNMNEEFKTLGEKKVRLLYATEGLGYYEEDVKEIVDLLKEDIIFVLGRGARDPRTFINIINKRFGDALTK